MEGKRIDSELLECFELDCAVAAGQLREIITDLLKIDQHLASMLNMLDKSCNAERETEGQFFKT